MSFVNLNRRQSWQAKSVAEHACRKTAAGKNRRLNVARCCICGVKYWEVTRTLYSVKPMNKRFCDAHWKEKYPNSKNRPFWIRNLTDAELEAQKREYEVKGVKVYNINDTQ